MRSVEEAAILQLLRVGVRVETRLRESDSGEIEFLNRGYLDIPRGAADTEIEFIGALRNLEVDGLVEAFYQANRFDSAEFLVRWTLK